MLKIKIKLTGPAGSGKTLALKCFKKLLQDNDFIFEEGCDKGKEGHYIKARRAPLTNTQYINARYKNLQYVRF